MDNETIIKKLKRIKYNIHAAVHFHDRSSLHEANDDLNNLLEQLGVQLPDEYSRITKDWLDD